MFLSAVGYRERLSYKSFSPPKSLYRSPWKFVTFTWSTVEFLSRFVSAVKFCNWQSKWKSGRTRERSDSRIKNCESKFEQSVQPSAETWWQHSNRRRPADECHGRDSLRMRSRASHVKVRLIGKAPSWKNSGFLGRCPQYSKNVDACSHW